MSTPTATSGIGLRRLQHLVLWVANVERSVRFYCDVLGFEVGKRYPNAAFLRIPGSGDDHNLGLFEQSGIAAPDERVARMYHAAWEVGELTDLVRAQRRLIEVGRAGGAIRSWREPVTLRQGPGRPGVRDLLDGTGRHARRHACARLSGELTRRGIRAAG